MKKMGKFLSVILMLILSLSLSGGCGQKTDSKPDTSKNVIKLRFAGQDPEGHPNTERLKLLKETVEKGSNGRIEISIYPANQLGDYTQVYEEIMKGTIDGGLINVPSQYDSKLELVYAPYLAESYEEAKSTFKLDSVVGKEYSKLQEKLGVKFLGFSMAGYVGVATTKELKDPAVPGGSKGVLLRVPPLDIFKIHMTDLGFRTVSIAYAELYTALQTGVADGCVGTTPLDTYATVKDVIKYYYVYNLFFDDQSIVMNAKKFNTLTPEDQKLITETCAKISEKSVADAAAIDKEYLDKLQKLGVKIIEFKPDELQEIADFTRKTTWPKLEGRLGKEMITNLQQGIK